MLWTCCAAVVSALEGKDCREAIKSIADNSSIPQERLGHMAAGMHRILIEAARIPTSSLKPEVGGSFLNVGPYHLNSHRNAGHRVFILSPRYAFCSFNPERNLGLFFVCAFWLILLALLSELCSYFAKKSGQMCHADSLPHKKTECCNKRQRCTNKVLV